MFHCCCCWKHTFTIAMIISGALLSYTVHCSITVEYNLLIRSTTASASCIWCLWLYVCCNERTLYNEMKIAWGHSETVSSFHKFLRLYCLETTLQRSSCRRESYRTVNRKISTYREISISTHRKASNEASMLSFKPNPGGKTISYWAEPAL